MTVLSAAQRKALSNVVADAREVVEAACAQRVSALAVALERVPEVLNQDERTLRRGLRARARQLGSVDALVKEAGFEHWHRMLFTRYLADNNLLVDDQTGQPVSIDEVAEYAAELGQADMWELAARFAAAMLPGLFRQDDLLLQIRLPVETRQNLEELLGSLSADIITAEDSLGWVYQYWQARLKDEVNRSEKKIGGADLAPVTQLFTEDYMVRFLLENSLGAWWATRHPDSPLLAEWAYLRFSEDGVPAAGKFEGWPETVAEVTVMDPCCGSGHFLTVAFGMLWRMRAEEERLDTTAAQDAVLSDNLFGLELDPRCTQIAAFALALDAWKSSGGYRPLPIPNLACSGIPAKAPLSDWIERAEGDPQLEAALARLHSLFANADTLGSLIDPIRAAEQAGLESVDWSTVAPLVDAALRRDVSSGDDPAAAVFGEAAASIARAADYLTRTYSLVCTNPPYLGRGAQSSLLQMHLDINFSDGKADLSNAFVIRALRMTSRNGAVALVTPENWAYLKMSKHFRRSLLSDRGLRFVCFLGAGAFGAITGEVVKGLLLIATATRNGSRLTAMLDVSKGVGPSGKATSLAEDSLSMLSQQSWMQTSDNVIVPEPSEASTLLERYASGLQGLSTADNARYVRCHWERPLPHEDWDEIVTAPDATKMYGGRNWILHWEDGQGALGKSEGAALRGQRAWGLNGIAVSRAGKLPGTIYLGERFVDAAAVILPSREDLVLPIWAFVSSEEFATEVRKINTKIIVANATLVKVPFDLDRWRNEAAVRYPDGLPEPYSADPTQWLFAGNPVDSLAPLQVAVARLVGYRWPHQQEDALEELADTDGIVCIPAVGGEPPARERLSQILARAYGESWNPAVLNALLSGENARPGAEGLGAWLRDGFFKEHCKLFSNRPFVWQIWDGAADGFSALVNYHRLDRKLLERLTYDYLGNWWIGRVRSEVANGLPGAETRQAAAERLKARLQLILDGEPPYDIYVRWKALAKQAMGWNPDLDDGVRFNIRPFMTAGVLRAQPVINWKKDRGKNSDGPDRLNDLHFTLAEKRASRGARQ